MTAKRLMPCDSCGKLICTTQHKYKRKGLCSDCGELNPILGLAKCTQCGKSMELRVWARAEYQGRCAVCRIGKQICGNCIFWEVIELSPTEGEDLVQASYGECGCEDFTKNLMSKKIHTYFSTPRCHYFVSKEIENGK